MGIKARGITPDQLLIVKIVVKLISIIIYIDI